MVRTELREHIFKMLFQIEFNDSVDMPENLNYYFETLEDAKEKDKQYIQNKYVLMGDIYSWKFLPLHRYGSA